MQPHSPFFPACCPPPTPAPGCKAFQTLSQGPPASASPTSSSSSPILTQISIRKPKSVLPEGRLTSEGRRRQTVKLRVILSSTKAGNTQVLMLVTHCSHRSSGRGCQSWNGSGWGSGAPAAQGVEDGARERGPWLPGSRELAWVNS